MALIDDVRTALRVSGNAMDSEIQLWMDAALADMRRVGIEATQDSETATPLMKAAVICYVKAHFGYDVDERPQFDEAYRTIVCDLMHSQASAYHRG